MSARLTVVQFSGWKSPVFNPLKNRPQKPAEALDGDLFESQRAKNENAGEASRTGGKKLSRRGVLGLIAAGIAASQVRKANAEAAQSAEPVDLALVLAVDVSYSVDADELKLQREGYIAALQNPRFLETIKRGPLGATAIAMVEWAGDARTVMDWEVIQDKADIARIVSKLEALPLGSRPSTNVGGAIEHSRRLLNTPSLEPTRRVIDISGDGVDNWDSEGSHLAQARQAAIDEDITINGLPIADTRPAVVENEGAYSDENPENVARFYEEEVIGGPGSFMVVARNYNDVGRALLRKLVTEVAGKKPDEVSGLA